MSWQFQREAAFNTVAHLRGVHGVTNSISVRPTVTPQQVKQKYQRRLKKLVDVLTRCGFDCNMPGGTYFLYSKSPRGVEGGPQFETAEAASQYLITEHSICTVPWDDAGAFLRFSVTYEAPDEKAEDALMAETEERLKKIRPIF